MDRVRRTLFVTIISLILLTVTFPAGAAPAQADRGAWVPNVWYNAGDTATYNGATYQTLQAHTSQTGWEPPNVPALWKLVGGSSPTQAPTRTPTRTNTPV